MRLETKKFIERLAAAGIANPASEFAEILDYVRGTKGQAFSPPALIDVDDRAADEIERLAAGREKRIPLARLLGRVSFADITLETGKGVFAPKPESEVLIDHAAALFKDREAFRLLDLGTGSGCLLLTLLHAFPKASGVGIDNSEAAIALALKNAEALALQNRAHFRLGNWSKEVNETFDLVISNPPRVASGDMAQLMPELRDHDPAQSLDGGPDGLEYYRLLAQDFRRITKEGGYGIFQVGPKHADAAARLFQSQDVAHIEIKPNYLGQPACLVVRKAEA